MQKNFFVCGPARMAQNLKAGEAVLVTEATANPKLKRKG